MVNPFVVVSSVYKHSNRWGFQSANQLYGFLGGRSWIGRLHSQAGPIRRRVQGAVCSVRHADTQHKESRGRHRTEERLALFYWEERKGLFGLKTTF